MKIDRLRTCILAAVVAAIPFSIAPAKSLSDCFDYPNHQRAFREAKAVFVGEVTTVERDAELPEDVETQVTQAITFNRDQRRRRSKGIQRTQQS